MKTKISKGNPIRLKRYVIILISIWFILICLSFLWNYYREKKEVLSVAKGEANGSFEKDLAYRRWATGHGGVYVPVTKETPPNPYLSQNLERDIVTPSGRKLTLMNPAYITRQVHELSVEQFGYRGHITSLNPIRPENFADPWEKEALKAFKLGEIEVSSVEIIDETPYLRFMRPMVTEKPCLQCHANQGHKVGDLRGGISFSIPLKPFYRTFKKHITQILIAHGFLLLVGFVGIGYGSGYARSRIRERILAEEKVKQYSENLEQRVKLRTTELEKKTADLGKEVTIRKEIERKLRAEKAYIDQLFESPLEAIVLLEKDGTVLRANDEFIRLFGYTIDEILGKSLDDLIASKEYYDEAVSATKKVFKGEKVIFETMRCCKNGTKIYVSVMASPIIVEDKLVAVYGIYRDITDSKRAEEELIKHTDELEKFNKAMVAREMRIIELKEEVNNLCDKLGQKPVYPKRW